MRKRWWWIIGIVVVVVGAPIAWYLGSPLFISKTVVEEFPMSEGATLPEGISRPQAEEEMMAATKRTTTASDPMPAETGVTILSRGKFVDADSFHQGSGTALIAQLGRQRFVRLEEFEVTNGPDLYVYLTAHPQPASRADVDQGFVSLGRLKGNIGSQNYEIPDAVDLSRFRAVAIYCLRFHVMFATATLGDAR